MRLFYRKFYLILKKNHCCKQLFTVGSGLTPGSIIGHPGRAAVQRLLQNTNTDTCLRILFFGPP